MKITTCLSWRLVVQALQNPVMVIAIAEFDERGPEIIEVAEGANPEQLLFECQKKRSMQPLPSGCRTRARWPPSGRRKVYAKNVGGVLSRGRISGHCRYWDLPIDPPIIRSLVTRET